MILPNIHNFYKHYYAKISQIRIVRDSSDCSPTANNNYPNWLSPSIAHLGLRPVLTLGALKLTTERMKLVRYFPINLNLSLPPYMKVL